MRPERLAPGFFVAAPQYSALLVEAHQADRAIIASVLGSAGLGVRHATNFRDAKAMLIASPPFLLVSEIRLGVYNGLHLAMRGRALRSDMVIVMTSHAVDAVLQADIERLRGTFVPKPTTAREVYAAIMRTAFREQAAERASEVVMVRPPFERRTVERRSARRAATEIERRAADRRRNLPWRPAKTSGFSIH